MNSSADLPLYQYNMRVVSRRSVTISGIRITEKSSRNSYHNNKCILKGFRGLLHWLSVPNLYIPTQFYISMKRSTCFYKMGSLYPEYFSLSRYGLIFKIHTFLFIRKWSIRN